MLYSIICKCSEQNSMYLDLTKYDKIEISVYILLFTDDKMQFFRFGKA
jgi:hypothetical protein